MEEVTRKRVMRLLEGLPEEQLYQVLDYIEFLAAKYAAAGSRKPDAFQRFAERVEDQMRVRALAPKAMKGTMKIMSTAGKVFDGVRDLGRDLVSPTPSAASRSPSSPGSKPAESASGPASSPGSKPAESASGPATSPGSKPAESASGPATSPGSKPAEPESGPVASPDQEGNGRRTESGA